MRYFLSRAEYNRNADFYFMPLKLYVFGNNEIVWKGFPYISLYSLAKETHIFGMSNP